MDMKSYLKIHYKAHDVLKLEENLHTLLHVILYVDVGDVHLSHGLS